MCDHCSAVIDGSRTVDFERCIGKSFAEFLGSDRFTMVYLDFMAYDADVDYANRFVEAGEERANMTNARCAMNIVD